MGSGRFLVRSLEKDPLETDNTWETGHIPQGSRALRGPAHARPRHRAPPRPAAPGRLPSSPRWRGGGSGARSLKAASPSCRRGAGPTGAGSRGEKGTQAWARASRSLAAQVFDVIGAAPAPGVIRLGGGACGGRRGGAPLRMRGAAPAAGGSGRENPVVRGCASRSGSSYFFSQKV